jgi:hypothetical protein
MARNKFLEWSRNIHEFTNKAWGLSQMKGQLCLQISDFQILEPSWCELYYLHKLERQTCREIGGGPTNLFPEKSLFKIK